MIVFDLKCAREHVFEAWFASSAAFDDQCAAGHVRCPLCDDASVVKAAMAPNIPVKTNQRPDAKQAMKALAQVQAKMLAGSRWVGTDFPDRARAMHAGEEPHGPIHGQASMAEAKALIDEGVPVAPLPLPVPPPERVN